jgi:F-type H+-transporting ATPase subunit epsilon
MHKFRLKILTPDEKLFEGEVEKVVLPTKAGEITVLANHIPLISLLGIGEVKIYKSSNSDIETLLLQGGVLDVKQKTGEMDEVIILADEKIGVDMVNNVEFEKSLDRAKNANQEDMSDYDPELLESLTEKSAYFKRMKRG